MRKISYLLIFVLCGLSHATRYKRYLSATQLESELANIVLHPRLQTSEWLDLLGPRKNDRYKVQVGDNFWRISQKVFGDPFLWRKLWQVNSMIANPHEIEPGTLLAFYREDQNALPVVKLRPNTSRGVASDLENDVVVNQTYNSRLRVTHVVVTDDSIFGKVTGGYNDKVAFTYLDVPYLVFNDLKKVKVGDVYGVARVEKIPKTADIGAGTLVRIVGDVKIIEVGENLAKAEVTGSYYTIERGDLVIPVQRMTKRPGTFSPPDELLAKIVAGEEPGHSIFGQGDIVILNKGVDAGMQEGFYFRVYRDTDPNLKNRNSVDPSYKGEVSVVYVAENISVGYLVRATDVIGIGDVLVPYKSFEDPPKRQHKEVEQIDVD